CLWGGILAQRSRMRSVREQGMRKPLCKNAECAWGRASLCAKMQNVLRENPFVCAQYHVMSDFQADNLFNEEVSWQFLGAHSAFLHTNRSLHEHILLFCTHPAVAHVGTDRQQRITSREIKENTGQALFPMRYRNENPCPISFHLPMKEPT
ncbi:MAG: hypothetical protein IKF96_07990, partial [Eggerthellaceae bacterium]|nr:hypothetical protein [Eggerthellaceae bacterium]